LVITFCSLIWRTRLPTPAYGAIERIENFNTELVEPRNIDIWLPEILIKQKLFCRLYARRTNAFDAKNLNKTSWDADDTFGELLRTEDRDCMWLEFGMF
jgi:hypothetical protein